MTVFLIVRNNIIHMNARKKKMYNAESLDLIIKMSLMRDRYLCRKSDELNPDVTSKPLF